jgi:3-oxoacyl-[acyl-carrier protein] reductase
VRDDLAGGLDARGLHITAIDVVADFDAALTAAGKLDAIVWAWTPPGLTTPAPLSDIDGSEWQLLVSGTLRTYVEFLQAAERRLRGGTGRIVIVIPTLALGGAAGLVPWATVAEGQRALAKSVARVWGSNGITVNCVAIPASLLAGTAAELGRPNLQQAALPDPSLSDEVAGAIAALCGEGMAAVTGATIAVDGGAWMPA